MLVLSRKKDESILIGEDIEIIISEISEDKVKIGVKAPKNVKIFRKELVVEVEKENVQSVVSVSVDLSKLSEALKENIIKK